MKVLYGLDEVPQVSQSIVTIGSFDGIHRGHQALFGSMKRIQQDLIRHPIVRPKTPSDFFNSGLLYPSVVITFEPHPRKVLYPENPVLIITPLELKLELLASFGVDMAIILPFSHELAQWSAQQFISHIHQQLNIHTLVIGWDFHFGKGRDGDFHYLVNFGKEHNVQVISVPKVQWSGMSPSSTLIRSLLLNQDFTTALELLGWEDRLAEILLQRFQNSQ